MKERLRKVFSCDHCNKKYFIKSACLKHEKLCFKNPENFRPCFDCKYLEKKDYKYYYDTGCGEDSKILTLFHCSKKNIFLHTPQVEIKGNAFDLGYEENIAMPKECNDFQSWTY